MNRLRDNIALLSAPEAEMTAERRAISNLSRALLEAMAALHAIEERMQTVERMLTQ